MFESFHAALIRAAFHAVYGWQPVFQHIKFLDQSQWWPWPQIQELQIRKLKLLLEHAYANVPFYQRRFDKAGLRPSDLKSAADLACLPVLTKREIQDHLADLRAQNMGRHGIRENHTGGSTGHPLTFYQDANYLAWAKADILRGYHWAGYQVGMRWAFLWGSNYDARTHKGHFGHLKDQIGFNSLWINTFDLTTETLTRAAEQLVSWQPQVLVAYVSSATLLAHLVRAKGIRGIRPRAIQTSAEVLTPADRHLLEDTFCCHVFDRYGSREVSNIAHECDAHQGLHILAENNLVELLDAENCPVGPGQLGRLVVTNLNNYVMPLIRYEIGDMGVAAPSPCACGRGAPLLEAVTGRITDMITSPSGKLLHGEFFTHLFYKVSGVYQFRVTQEARADLVVQIVPAPGFDRQQVLAFLEDAIHQHGDPAFRLRFEICDHLSPTASGKYRFTRSLVPLDLAASKQ